MRSGRIRPAVDGDLEGICALTARVHPDRPATLERTRFMNEVLFTHPWRDERLPSLIYEDTEGCIRGFLGIMPRRMALRTRPLQAAISHRLMVDAAHRGSLAGLSLVKTFLAGPQDLSITEPENRTARRIFERFGAFAVESQSLKWTKPVRPFGWVAQHAPGRLSAHLRRVAGGVPGAIDAGIGTLGRLRPLAGKERSEALTAEGMLEITERVSSSYALRPSYNLQQLGWLLDRLEGKRSRGVLRGRLLKAHDGAAVGFYIYYVCHRRTGLVVNVCARPDRISTVWRHLIADAWNSGTVALSGKFDAMMAGVSDRALFVRRAPHTFLIQTRHQDVERAVTRGDAFLTRLQGEGGIPFGDGPADEPDDE